MDIEKIESLLRSVKSGKTKIPEAMETLRNLPFEDIGFSKVDHHRQLRQGFPEVIFGARKTIAQVTEIAQKIMQNGGPLLATRTTPEMYSAIVKIFPSACFNELAKTITIGKPIEPMQSGILVVSAGTSDIPIAEEAVETATIMGNKVDRLYDVGVAGLHRLLSNYEKLKSANVVIVVAGMEGALASVIGGLIDKPLIAVPTSVGYGSHLDGIATLLAMLNSCASGLTVVNIDNGFGAGYSATLINRLTRINL